MNTSTITRQIQIDLITCTPNPIVEWFNSIWYSLSIIDTKKTITSTELSLATFIKLNEVEFKKNQHLKNDLEDKILITLGENGVQYMGKKYHSPNPQDTIDVSGAGDTFTASFILKYFTTRGNIDESIRFANEVCSNVVNKKGVALPSERFKIVF